MFKTEDYVDFETAKLLKQKEYNHQHYDWYDINGQRFHDVNSFYGDFAGNLHCPTLYEVVNWLTDTHDLHLETTMSSKDYYFCKIVKNPGQTHKGSGNFNYFDFIYYCSFIAILLLFFKRKLQDSSGVLNCRRISPRPR